MTAGGRRLLVWCSLAPAAVMCGLSLARPTFFTYLDYAAYDVMVRAIPLRPVSDRIVIIDIDERSLTGVGQWPWRRSQIAELISRLRGLGVVVVALDVIFAEPERNEASSSVNPDASLAEAIANRDVILGYAFRFDEAATWQTACGRTPLRMVWRQPAGDESTPASPLFRATGAVCNVAVLSQAAPASGFLNAAPDADGILRRVPLLLEFGGRTYPALALAAVSAMLGTNAGAATVTNAHAITLSLGGAFAGQEGSGRQVDLDGAGNLLLRFRGRKRTIRHVSAIDVLESRVDPASLRNTMALVGTTALGTREVVATPLDTLFAGVEVQATVADNLLQQDALHRPAFGRSAETALLIVLCAATAWGISRWGLAWGALAGSGLIVAVWASCLWMMSAWGVVLSPFYPMMGGIAAAVGMTGVGLTSERRRADRARRDQMTTQRLMIETLMALTETRDAETGQHSRRIQRYTQPLADELAGHPRFRDYLTPTRRALLSTLAGVHDIGKVGTPDAVLNKAGKLTSDELAEMRLHPVRGRDVIANAERAAGSVDDAALALAKEIVYTHHEKWDGTGYPAGLSGDAIPIPGRIVALVDVYDALVTDRPYRRRLSHAEAVAIILDGRGTHFDPTVVDAFLKVSAAFEQLSSASERALGQTIALSGNQSA
jgi:adenylate cyclase